MENNANFKESLIHAFSQFSKKDRIVWILQIILSVTILVVAILGLNDVYPIYLTNVIDLVLLFFLFIICGIKFLPERIIYAIIYFVVAAMIGAVLVASFFI